MLTVEERFWSKVEAAHQLVCWHWLGAVNSREYGVFWEGGRQVYAHRFIYQKLVGEIPDGLTIDHLCRKRNCVNPSHMEPVTSKTNTLRGEGPTAQNARKTHCDKGHELVRITRNRYCRVCNTERVRLQTAARSVERK